MYVFVLTMSPKKEVKEHKRRTMNYCGTGLDVCCVFTKGGANGNEKNESRKRDLKKMKC